MITLLAAAIFIRPAVATQPVGNDADDPAIWRNREDPAESLVLGTNKNKRPEGAIVVFDLKGKIRQRFTGIDRPNNVDVLYDLPTTRGFMDVALTSERLAGRVRAFKIDPEDLKLEDVTGRTAVIGQGLAGVGEPMGIVSFKRQGRAYAVIAPKEGLPDGYLELYEVRFNGLTERVDLKFLRRFGSFSGRKEIEALAYDPSTDTLFYSDETYGNRRVPMSTFLSSGPFNTDFKGDHEGIDLWQGDGGRGYLVCTFQIPERSVYRVMDSRTLTPLGDFTAGADETDGIAVESRPLGPRFPRGLMVVMDSKRKRFLYIDWRDVENRLGLKRLPATRRNP
jgi:3-phytase